MITSMNKVNVILQCALTLFLPTGLYAFKKIGKLKLGILSYVLSFVAMYLGILGYMLLTWNNSVNMIEQASHSVPWMALTSSLIPIVFIRKWSIEYNKKIKEEQNYSMDFKR